MAQPIYRRQHGRAGLLLYALSAALLVASFGLLAVLRSDPVGWAGFAALPLGLLVYARARRFRVRIFANVEDLLRYIEEHGEKLILFLREFASDGARVRDPGEALPDFVATEEERIAGTLGDYGTVVAIGRPEERLPAAGSCRIYVEPDQWRDVVSRLIGRADLIVLRPGTTAGISWELEQIVAQGRIERTALIPAQDLDKNLAAYDRLRAIFPEPPDPMPALFEKIASSDLMDDETKRMARDLKARAEGAAGLNRVLDQLALVPKLAPAILRLREGRLVQSKGSLKEAIVDLAHQCNFKLKGRGRLKLALVFALVFVPIPLLAAIHFLACPLLSPADCRIAWEAGIWTFVGSGVLLFVLMFMMM